MKELTKSLNSKGIQLARVKQINPDMLTEDGKPNLDYLMSLYTSDGMYLSRTHEQLADLLTFEQ